MWSAELVVNSIESQLGRLSGPVCVFWVQVLGDRGSYAAEVKALSSNKVVPLIVRRGAFDDPNSLSEDLVRVISENRESFGSAQAYEEKYAILLLARNEFGIPQVSSPAVLPEWFPAHGGELVSASIVDLTWIAEAPLNGPNSRIGDLCAGLFRLEESILARIRMVHSRDHNSGNAFFELIKRGDTERYDQLLDDMSRFRMTVKSPAAFRPSVRQGMSLVGRLWQVSGALPVEQLGRFAKALSRALDLPESLLVKESIVSVLYRPSTRDPSFANRFSRNLIGLNQAACQLITAAAHADDYNAYPVALLRSISYDLRSGLNECEIALRSLEI